MRKMKRNNKDFPGPNLPVKVNLFLNENPKNAILKNSSEELR